MKEAEHVIDVMKSVVTDRTGGREWRKKFHWDQVIKAINRMDALVRLGYLAEQAGYMIGKKGDGGFEMVKRPEISK